MLYGDKRSIFYFVTLNLDVKHFKSREWILQSFFGRIMFFYKKQKQITFKLIHNDQISVLSDEVQVKSPP